MPQIIDAKKLSNLIGFLSRVTLGGIFVYSGIFKILNPQVFKLNIENYKIVPEWMVSIISELLPYVEFLLGLFLILNLLRLISSLAALSLLTVFVIITVSNSLTGGALGCGCFPKSSFLNSDNAVFLVVRNYFFILLALLSLPSYIRKRLHGRIRDNRFGFLALLIFIILSLAVPLTATIIAQRANVNKYHIFVANELKVFKDEADNGVLKDLVGANLHDFADSSYELGPDQKVGILLTLNSSSCSICVDEAIYLNGLKRKYGKKVAFYLAVGNIGHTAVGDLVNTFLIDYPVIQDARLLNFKGFSYFKSLRTIISREGVILRLEPLTYNLKELRLHFEQDLDNFLE